MATPFSNSVTLIVEDLLEILIRHLYPDKVYLLATRDANDMTQSIFSDASPELTDCDKAFFLTITSTGTGDPHLLIDRIEKEFTGTNNRTILLTTTEFNSMICNEHPFALSVLRNAPVCYDSGYSKINSLPVGTTSSKIENANQSFTTALHYLSESEEFVSGNNYALAAHSLKLALVKSLAAIFQLATGYFPSTTNLERLYQYTMFVSPELRHFFPRSGPDEESQFQILYSFHTNGLSPDITTSLSKLSTLHSTIKKLLEQCQHQIH
jgi:hypothetical protein